MTDYEYKYKKYKHKYQQLKNSQNENKLVLIHGTTKDKLYKILENGYLGGKNVLNYKPIIKILKGKTYNTALEYQGNLNFFNMFKPYYIKDETWSKEPEKEKLRLALDDWYGEIFLIFEFDLIDKKDYFIMYKTTDDLRKAIGTTKIVPYNFSKFPVHKPVIVTPYKIDLSYLKSIVVLNNKYVKKIKNKINKKYKHIDVFHIKYWGKSV